MTSPLPPRPKTAPGVRIAGIGSAIPSRVVRNADLERLMDTSDEWIVQRTGIHERRVVGAGESTLTLSADALRNALRDASLSPSDLDLLILATMTPEMSCPASACRLAAEVGARDIGAWDLSAACCGFVFALNNAYALIRTGMYRCIAVIGADTISRYTSYDNENRATSILFGDGAGAVVLRATDDPTKGVIAQRMHSDGGRWVDLYIPESLERDIPAGHEASEGKLRRIQMNGKAVFKFAVSTFSDVIQQTLDEAGLSAGDVAMFVCHQSNARILHAARERFGLSEDRLYVNIERFGNTVAASVPLCLDELHKKGKIREGDRVMFVAFGGGLTWGTSLWQL